MNTRLRSISVKIVETLARWERMETNCDYARTMRGALARGSFLVTDGQYLSREEAHDRARLR